MSSPKEIDSLINQKQLQSQKTIGMIGGTSWESTLLYYKLINESIRDRLGGLSSAKLLLYSLNYDPIVNLERKNKWDEVGQQIEISAKILQKAGADFLILCCNTLHKVTAYIESAIKIPFLHIADAAGKKLSNTQIKKNWTPGNSVYNERWILCLSFKR